MFLISMKCYWNIVKLSDKREMCYWNIDKLSDQQQAAYLLASVRAA